MPEDYTVREGDCIASLAYGRGLLWQKVWNHPTNADLKSQRKDPNILFPGDHVFLPDKEPKTLDRPTEQRHKFVKKGTPAKLRLRILEDQLPEVPPHDNPTEAPPRHFTGEDPDTSSITENQQPRANAPYTLVIDGKTTTGETDSEGRIEVSIPPNANTGRLTLEPGTLRETIMNLNLGYLDPAGTNAGIKTRLAHFGFDCGDRTNDVTPAFQDAVRTYQESRGLNATGEMDDATRDRLTREHGS